MLTCDPKSPRTELRAGIDFLGKIARRRAVAFLVSDFLADGWQQAMRVAAKKHDLVPVVIADPMEEALPDVGFMTVEDLETGEVLEFDTGGPEAREYEALVKRRASDRPARLRRMSIETAHGQPDKPSVDGLAAFCPAREKRMRH